MYISVRARVTQGWCFNSIKNILGLIITSTATTIEAPTIKTTTASQLPPLPAAAATITPKAISTPIKTILVIIIIIIIIINKLN